MNKDNYRLYLVSDRSWLKEGETLEQVVEEAILGGVSVVQLREKSLSYDDFLMSAKRIKKVTDKYGIPLIINDNVDIALEVHADGVHIGMSDGDIAAIRERVGKDLIIGASARTVESAREAEKKGADYLGVGAVFGTTTKKDAKTISPELLKEIAGSVNIPVVAIGGVNKDNVSLLKGTGIAGIAVVSAILKENDKKAAAANLNALVGEAMNV